MSDYHSREAVTSRLRLRGFDYAAPSTVFVTLCTQHRACLFGEIIDGTMHLSRAGVVTESWWYTIPARFPSVMVDAMVVMPNHMHGVLHIGTGPGLENSPSLGDVMQWFKTRTTYDYILGVKTEGRPRFPGRLWQKGYYDRIVRDDRELARIRTYIEDNPRNWSEDDYHQPA